MDSILRFFVCAAIFITCVGSENAATLPETRLFQSDILTNASWSASSSLSPMSGTTPELPWLNVTNSTWASEIVLLHNIHRRNHSSRDLTWSVDLSNRAFLAASTCVFDYHLMINGGGYGQIIRAGTIHRQTIEMMNDLYYSGLEHYTGPFSDDLPDMTHYESWRDFAQMVWDETTEIGCMLLTCHEHLDNTPEGVPPYYTVCNYSPRGNLLGEYHNVRPPRGPPTSVFPTPVPEPTPGPTNVAQRV